MILVPRLFAAPIKDCYAECPTVIENDDLYFFFLATPVMSSAARHGCERSCEPEESLSEMTRVPLSFSGPEKREFKRPKNPLKLVPKVVFGSESTTFENMF